MEFIVSFMNETEIKVVGLKYISENIKVFLKTFSNDTEQIMMDK